MKARLVLPVVYGVLFVAALMWMLILAKQTAFCGVPLVLLTIPWSLIATSIISPSTFGSSMLPGTLILSLCGLLNGAIAFLIGAGIDRLGRGSSDDK